jgi:hypothetical protein
MVGTIKTHNYLNYEKLKICQGFLTNTEWLALVINPLAHTQIQFIGVEQVHYVSVGNRDYKHHLMNPSCVSK